MNLTHIIKVYFLLILNFFNHLLTKPFIFYLTVLFLIFFSKKKNVQLRLIEMIVEEEAY